MENKKEEQKPSIDVQGLIAKFGLPPVSNDKQPEEQEKLWKEVIYKAVNPLNMMPDLLKYFQKHFTISRKP